MNNALSPEFWRLSGEVTHEGRLGVIDIGSNSIRLVVYDAIKRAPLPLFNEKVFCSLGKGLATTGKLNPEGVKLAEACIARFLALVRIMDVVELQILATAAVRDATDGAAFVEALERKHRIDITVISGKKEARLAADGVCSSIYMPEGLAGDLGGGSIELIGLDGGNINEQSTLPIGPLRLLDAGKGDKDKMRRLIIDAIDAERWLEKAHPPHFYAIGGSFRALAHIHMAKEAYPLDIVHHYTIKNGAMRKLLKEIHTSSPQEIAKMAGAPAKRAEALIPAALVLEHILDITEPIDVVFSSSGIREGYLFEKLSPSLRSEDPLIASSADMASQNGQAHGFAHELFHWMTPLFTDESGGTKRLRFAACTLSEIAWRIHPEYRAEWLFFRIIQSTLTGLSHPERVTLALALYHRHQFKLKHGWKVLELIREREMTWARLVGTAAGLAFQISGGRAGHLNKAPLSLLKHEIELAFAPEVQDLMSDAVRKRVDGLGEAFKAFAKSAK
jgi:exopolyphosphatase/guanosine-5'-triphosphate,3'-diphosphate pyrophosphatase